MLIDQARIPMNDQGKVLVTGGLGFIGRHLVRALTDRGHRVRVLDINQPGNYFAENVEILTGSVLDRQLVANAMQGVSVVYHLAGIPHLWQPDPKEFFRVNVEGTRTVLAAAVNSGIKRLVYTSSETMLRGWRNRSSNPIDESEPLPDLDELPGPYSRSKLKAELEVNKAVKQGMPAVVVYPTIPIGAGDTNLTPPTRMIKDFLNEKNPAFLECNLNLIPVQAVAEGHILAAEKGVIGDRYILGQENMKMSELLKLLEQFSGRKMPGREVPYSMALLIAKSMEYAAKFRGKPPPASVEGVRLAGANMMFDCSKAQQELGLSKYSLQEALEQTIAWLRNMDL